MTEGEKPTVTTDAIKQQVDILSQWSRFYHDAEIKVNSTSIVISAVASVGDRVTPGSFSLPMIGRDINVLGVVIALASIAALISTLGYWRYYELCDLLGKKYRDRNLPQNERDAVRAEFEAAWKRYFVLRWIPENSHHLVWLVIQGLLTVLGVYLALHPKSS